MTERLLSTGDVAEALGVSEATIKRWADAGTLSCIRTPGGHRKFRLRDMTAYLASRTPHGSGSPADDKRHIEQITEALSQGDVVRVMSELAPERLQRVPVSELATKWLIPAFKQIVSGRSDGNFHAYHEMMALHVLQDVAARQRAHARQPRSFRGRLLVVAMPGSFAEVWSRFAGLVGVENGYESLVLSAGLDAADIVKAAEDLKPDLCVIVTTDLQGPEGRSMLDQINMVADSCQLAVAMLDDVTDDLPNNVQVLKNLRDLQNLFVPAAFRVKSAR